MKTRRLLARLLRVLLAAGAGVVVLLALAVGGFRLLVAQLPSYQAELKQWVDSSLGMTLDFDHMDARLGLRGPELTFRDVSVTVAGEPRPFLAAGKASVTIDPWTAIAKRRLRIDRLTFDGTRLTLVRESGGELHLLGAPAGRETKLDFALLVPPGVEIGVSNSSVAYVDRSSGVSWRFQNVHAALTRGRDALELHASAEPPPELGSRFELDASTELRSLNDLGRNWRVFADLRDVDLGALALALPTETEIPASGNGDLGVWLEWRGGRLEHAMLETALDGVAWAAAKPDTAAKAGATAEAGAAAKAGATAEPDAAAKRGAAARAGAASASTPAAAAARTSSAAAGQLGARRSLDGYRHLALSAEWQRKSDGWRLMLNDIDLQRAGRTWPRGTDAILDVAQGPGGIDKLALRSDFVRLEDLAPFVRALPRSALADRWLQLDPHGEVTGADISFNKKDQTWDYTISGRFDRLGLKASGRWPGFEGLSGELHADAGGGRVNLATQDAELDWRQLFRRPLQVGNLSGLVVWRKGFDGVRVVSNDLLLSNADGSTRSSLELTLPLDGSSPRLDMETHIGPFDVVAAKRYLPVHKMPAGVVSWLDDALQGGRVTQADMRFVGPLAAFPFDGGEGKFHVVASVEGGVLEYARDWPRAEDLDGQIEFSNASFAARAKGRVLRNAGRDVRVDIADLRKARVVLHAATSGPLADVFAFLQGARPIAERLGPGYDRLHAPAGRGTVTLDLDLPLHDRAAYRLDAKLGIADGTLAVDGFQPRVTGIKGTLELSDRQLHGHGLQGVFLNGPITADVLPPPPGLSSYRAAIDFKGEVTADAVTSAFHLPFAKLAAGQARWQGQLLIPAQPQDGVSEPLKIDVSSNLAGLALNFPAPFGKAPADPVNLGLAIELPDSGHLNVSGHLGSTKRFAVTLADSGGGRRLTRGALSFGGAAPAEPVRGLVVNGTLPMLDFDAWLGVLGASAPGSSLADASVGSLFERASLDIADLRVFGQHLGASRLEVHSDRADWLIDIASKPVAGHITVPRDLSTRPQVVAHMQRLFLERGDDGKGEITSIDPRELVGLTLEADQLGFGKRRFGKVEADIRPDPLGLRLVSFKSLSKAFSAQGNGSWLDGPDGSSTQLSLELRSSDVAGALADLALDPIAAGKKADIKARVEWPGPPSADWMQHVSGRASVDFETGSLLDIDPGAGRVVGLMSVSALPRRLALDFRDVFNKGLVFDDITGDFELVDGNAYTNNLKVSSPAAEIGIAGRVGLRDRDYSQQAVVATEPGKVLPTVGGLIGGPGVGAALLLFTRIFKQPLKGIGRASYCIKGSWDAPKVERLTPGEVQQGKGCAELPPGGLTPAAKEAN